MIVIAYLLLITQIIIVLSVPIDDGADVGTIQVQNGKKVVLNPGKFPYIVHLDIETERIEENPRKVFEVHGYCGGTLIKPAIVLSAAHCLGDPKRKLKITAWLGILDTNLEEGGGQEIRVKGFTIHDNYIGETSPLENDNDIAILWLARPAKPDGKYVKVANLPTKDFDAIDKRGWIIGWGTGSCGKKHSMLQKAVVRGVSSSECQKYYHRAKIPSTFICVMSDDKKKTSTSGDSGGPFIVRDTVVGVSSFGAIDWKNTNEEKGIIACDAKKPAAYTYVPKYLDWIQSTLNEGPKTLIIKPRHTRPQVVPTRSLPPRLPQRGGPHKNKL